MSEGKAHLKAKQRLRRLLERTDPKPFFIEEEFVYHNPRNTDYNPKYEFRFDIFGAWPPEKGGLKIAIEVDGKIGHYSPRSYKKREHRTAYLKTQGIELYGFPTQWITGKKALPDSLFYEEMHLA